MMFARLKLIAVASVFFAVAACGGGGGGGSGGGGTQNQTIVFTTPGSVSAVAGTTFTNTASGGGGTGAVTYVSSNLPVATVDPSTGVVSALAVGTATITATKAASSGFNTATASYTLNVTPGTQTVSFAQTGPIQALAGNTVTNLASGGAGTGSITYSSSNPTAASVNATSGVVTAISAGSTVITATKPADANFALSSAAYSVNVVETASFGAWIGSSDSTVSLEATANGSRLLRARDRLCNFAAINTCTPNQTTTVLGAPGVAISDTIATLNDVGFYALQNETLTSASIAVNARRFSQRIGHGALFFNNRYWVIGGGIDGTSLKADVWSSADGRSWELETSSASFGARWMHQSVVFSGAMWVIGGSQSSTYSSTDGVTWTQTALTLPFASTSTNARVAVFNGGTGTAMWAIASGNVYKSTNGVTWTQQATNVSVGGPTNRANASLTVFAGKLWYIGGAPGYVAPTAPANPASNSVNEVWSSPDGLTWTQESAPPFSGRMNHASFVLNSRLWVFGGRSVVAGVAQPGSLADAYSTDGTTWRAEALNTEIDRSTFLMPALNEVGKVTLIGGVLRGYSNKVHQSTDGVTWTELSPYAQFSPRLATSAISFLGDLWIIGGATLNEVDNNDIWRSSDGLNWTKVTPATPIFSARDNHETLVFNGRLWVIGGWGNTVSVGGTSVRLRDVWSSADGIAWREETSNAGFSPRISFGAAVFNNGISGNRMWVVGGETGTNTFTNDVWSSADGVIWNQVASNPPFSARGGLTLTSFGGQLWVVAGGNVGFIEGSGGTAQADVWRSTDGLNWTQVTTVGPIFSPRLGHESVVHNNRLWVIGGSTPGIGYNSDAWWTSDGVTWTAATTTAPFGFRSAHSVVTHNGEMWLMTGYDGDRYNDVWRSGDGANWRVGFNGVLRMR